MANTLLPVYQNSQLLAGFGESSDLTKLLETWQADGSLLTMNQLPEGTEIKNGALVELRGRMHRSPLLTALDAFLQLMNISGYETNAAAKPGVSRLYPVPQGIGQGETAILDIFQNLRNQLTDAPLQDCLMLPAGDLLALLTVPSATLPLLFTGDYRVIGKISRVVPPGEELSLYERTSYNYLDKSFFQSSFDSLNEIPWLRVPGITTHLPGPAVQVLPIAVLI
jgi:hypothetical protein